MEFDINTLRSLATVFCMAAFLGVVLWAYSDRKKNDFESAANLPFESDAPVDLTDGKNNKESAHV